MATKHLDQEKLKKWRDLLSELIDEVDDSVEGHLDDGHLDGGVPNTLPGHEGALRHLLRVRREMNTAWHTMDRELDD